MDLVTAARAVLARRAALVDDAAAAVERAKASLGALAIIHSRQHEELAARQDEERQALWLELARRRPEASKAQQAARFLEELPADEDELLSWLGDGSCAPLWLVREIEAETASPSCPECGGGDHRG